MRDAGREEERCSKGRGDMQGGEGEISSEVTELTLSFIAENQVKCC